LGHIVQMQYINDKSLKHDLYTNVASNMKKILFIVIGIFTLIILTLVFVISKPDYLKYQAEVYGVVLNENGDPISNAEISRIGEKISTHPEFGYHVETPYISDLTYSDENGKFSMKSKSKLIFTWSKRPTKECELNLEINKNGYLKYKSKENEWVIENEFYLCNEKVFKPKIILKKSE